VHIFFTFLPVFPRKQHGIGSGDEENFLNFPRLKTVMIHVLGYSFFNLDLVQLIEVFFSSGAWIKKGHIHLFSTTV